MADWHLEDIRNELERAHWKVVAELDGDDYKISGVWQIARPDGTCLLHLEFHGSDDLVTFPISQAYACYLTESKDISLYLGKKGGGWKETLRSFISELDNVAT